MSIDRPPSAIRQQVCSEPFDQRDSHIQVPEGPGLGVEVDEYVVRDLSI